MPSVLWCCWLGSRKGIRPVKKLSGGVLAWLSVWSTAQLMPLPLTVSCFSKIQVGFTFLVLAHPGSPGQRAVKRVCVSVCVCVNVTGARETLFKWAQSLGMTSHWCQPSQLHTSRTKCYYNQNLHFSGNFPPGRTWHTNRYHNHHLHYSGNFPSEHTWHTAMIPLP